MRSQAYITPITGATTTAATTAATTVDIVAAVNRMVGLVFCTHCHWRQSLLARSVFPEVARVRLFRHLRAVARAGQEPGASHHPFPTLPRGFEHGTLPSDWHNMRHGHISTRRATATTAAARAAAAAAAARAIARIVAIATMNAAVVVYEHHVSASRVGSIHCARCHRLPKGHCCLYEGKGKVYT